MSLEGRQWGIVLECLCNRHNLDWFFKEAKVYEMSESDFGRVVRAQAATAVSCLMDWPFEGKRLSAEFKVPQLGQEMKSERGKWASSGLTGGVGRGQGQNLLSICCSSLPQYLQCTAQEPRGFPDSVGTLHFSVENRDPEGSRTHPHRAMQSRLGPQPELSVF